MFLDYFVEFHTLFFRPIRMAQLAKDKDLEAIKTQELKDQIPRYFSSLQRHLDKQKTNFLASNKLTGKKD